MYNKYMASEIPMTDARAHLADLANRVVYGGEHIVLTRHGKPFAALVSIQDLGWIEAGDTHPDAQSSSVVANLDSSGQAYPRTVAASYSPPTDPGGPTG